MVYNVPVETNLLPIYPKHTITPCSLRHVLREPIPEP